MEQSDMEQVERPWPFAIGQAVTVAGVSGEVVWRRENSAGERDYEVKTEAGTAWIPEAEVGGA